MRVFWVWPSLHVRLQGKQPLPVDSLLLFCVEQWVQEEFLNPFNHDCMQLWIPYSSKTFSELHFLPGGTRTDWDNLWFGPNSTWKDGDASSLRIVISVKTYGFHWWRTGWTMSRYLPWCFSTLLNGISQPLLYSVDSEPKEWLRSGNSKSS